jgi:fucose 4-O-acetylase-like acetyltransferase
LTIVNGKGPFAAPKRYVAWVDVAKGGAVGLVVLGHAWRGLYAGGLVSEEPLRILNDAIYAFHMPFFS